jgi:4-amino-4-deoxychorismate lyase
MMLAAWIDGAPAAAVAITDRALHYGDQAFTTLRVHAARPCWLDAHVGRLREACAAMRLAEPDWHSLRADIAAAAAVPGAGVIKAIVSRGDGARGYAPHDATGRRIVIAYAALPVDVALYRDGVALRFAEWPLAEQPGLAGIKHGNRLDQVMARAEWRDDGIHDALMCTPSGAVVAATTANVFARFGDELRTPVLDRAGVAGVCRARVLQSPPAGFSATVAVMSRDELMTADELFLSNAVRGVVPVRTLADHRYASMSAAHALMRALHPTLGLPVID